MFDLLAAFDGEQLLADLDVLGAIGLHADAGLQRMAYGAADLAGRAWVQAQMQALGMDATIDAAGNVVGRYAGHEDLPAIALGSHTDSVPGGGKFDGALGVLAALACIRTLYAAGERLRHPLLVIDFAAEEATTSASPTGSLSFVGCLDAALLDGPAWQGASTRSLLEQNGFDIAAMVANQPPEPIAAFLELHIEQGDHLAAYGVPVGVVEGIVGIRRYYVTFIGQANHAGTTSMARRRDALLMAAPFITATRATAIRHGIVATIGHLDVHPGAPNVIPGRVTLDLEIRGMDNVVLDAAEGELAGLAVAGGGAFARGNRKEPAPAAPRLMAAIERACQMLTLDYVTMPSGAGHDAMNMAAICPYAMIFVPSQEGISHAPEEFTHAHDCVNGGRVLFATLLDLDETLTSSQL